MVEKVDSHRRRDILQAAAALFRQRGYERTSVRHIADAQAMTSGSLFYHFTAKEEILVAVMEEGIRDVFVAVQAGLEREHLVPEKLLTMVRCHLGALLGPRLDALMVLVSEWRSLSAPSARCVLAWRKGYEDLWDDALASAALQGWVHGDVVLVRQTVLGAVNWTGQWYRREHRLDVDELALHMYELLFPGLFRQLGGQTAVAKKQPGPQADGMPAGPIDYVH